MKALKLLDLFCGAGGCSMGYWQAGFHDITGVDINPQKNYPFDFCQADVFEWCANNDLSQFDLIHASPPCQNYSIVAKRFKNQGKKYSDLLLKARAILKKSKKLYVIENVKYAPLKNGVMLCGTMFGLMVIRHRYFECNPEILFPPYTCNHHSELTKQGRTPKKGTFITVTGHFGGVEYAKKAMGINWMIQKELSQAIPPAYTKWIGEQIIEQFKGAVK